ncbi:MAG: hypothetical protein FWD06_02040 [Oscillospiraceae bacterium]|nr:hypothetical protein [Oscillospiraceae bacterium]
MKKRMLIIIAAALGVALLAMTLLLVVPLLARTSAENDHETTTEYTTTEEDTTAVPVDSDQLVWRVAPTLEVEGIIHCSCDMFVVDDNTWRNTVDPITGAIISNSHGGHGGGGGMWVFDPIEEMLGNSFFGEGYDFGHGMHPIDNFAASLQAALYDYFSRNEWSDSSARAHDWTLHAVETSNRRMVVQLVDSTLRDDREWDDGGWSLRPEARQERFVIIENRRPISPWFDAITGSAGGELFAAANGDAWQFINHRGVPLFPAQFEHIVLIDSETAFVRHNGRYGILDILATAQHV